MGVKIELFRKDDFLSIYLQFAKQNPLATSPSSPKSNGMACTGPSFEGAGLPPGSTKLAGILLIFDPEIVTGLVPYKALSYASGSRGIRQSETDVLC